ncbi:very-long-chain 3-oxoacyl-CoA reductase-like [Ambystoma mexicanum]|uniref:very-long-chain 3-oxoacyl-CoA reductase-like n=1 Tax=Ambystoma mexicanum TaxID=8296 RepID=UPI0037E8A128
MPSEETCAWSQALSYLGAFTAVYITVRLGYKILRGLRVHLLSEVWRKDVRSYGQWAVVTGATSGIGKAYAQELAKRGLDVVLISRKQELLENVAKEIEEMYGGKTKIIQADFNKGPEIYEPIKSGLKDLNIGILVNNVGMMFSHNRARFLDTVGIEEKIPHIINCNMLSLTKMTQIVLPGMVKRKRGAVINISSEAGAHPTPLFNVYSSTKAYVSFFSKALEAEYRNLGITVQCVAPLLVSTKMVEYKKPSLMVKTAEDFAREAVNTIGLTSSTNGCLSHSIQSFVCELLAPEWLRLSDYSVNQILKTAVKQ